MSWVSTTTVDQSLTSSITSQKVKNSSQLSKVYKEATTLYLTRRLAEAWSILQPIVSEIEDDSEENDGLGSKLQPAPVASAKRSTRVKIWCLYLTLLNAIADLSPEEGQEAFGSKDWKGLIVKAQDGSIWDEVVNIGYGGDERTVDAEVVTNLANLLLAQSPSQKKNQDHLEVYLSAFHHSDTDPAKSLQEYPISNGVSNLKELENQIQIIELYALHVLPRNEEWNYARDYLTMNQVLDEDAREALLQTLTSLEHEENGTTPLRELEPIQDPEENRSHNLEHSASTDSVSTVREKPVLSHTRSHGERDYGIEDNSRSDVNETTKISTPTVPSYEAIHQTKQSKLSRPNSHSISRRPPQTGLYKRSMMLLSTAQRLSSYLLQFTSHNPFAVLRFILFLTSLIAALSRQEVRDRLRAVWQQLRRTLGMGVKVSYI